MGKVIRWRMQKVRPEKSGRRQEAYEEDRYLESFEILEDRAKKMGLGYAVITYSFHV